MKGDSIIRTQCLDVPSGPQQYLMSLAGQVEEHIELDLPYKVHTTVISSPKALLWDSLVDLCQRRSDQMDSGPCKQSNTVLFFAVRYLEMHSTKPLLNSAEIQPEAQDIGVPGNSSNPAQHKMHRAEIVWVYFWKHCWSCFSSSAVERDDL
ncbi:hypothetical protein WISP_62808 [Willisornis vidua]|uniref:Uncharacterized protein n=1 Tax=Willisornis vidua TaxID=1566151 RepID=A0ABQ9DA14_9PASS|nr:hypothetical protein WISP_62808 [Willisornis vidua]